MQNNDPKLTKLDLNEYVSKADPRIAFRGSMDGVIADICFGIAIAAREKNDWLIKRLEEVKDCCFNIMSSHVKGTNPLLPKVCGKTADQMHEISHNTHSYFNGFFFLPSASDGEAVAWLNVIRVHIRDAERALITAAEYAESNAEALILAMNRLSSIVYVLMCMECAKKHDI